MREFEPPEVDPDYGVFGDPGSVSAPSRALDSPDEQRRKERLRKQREAADQVSSNFNRHMIDSYNAARRGER